MNYKEIPDGSFGGMAKKGVQVYCDNRGLTYTVVSMALCQVKVGRTAVGNNDWNVVKDIPYFVHNYVNNFNVGAKVIHIFTGDEFILKTRGLVRSVCQVETGEGDTVYINPERLMPVAPGMVLRHRKTGTEKVFLNLADYEREKAEYNPLGCYVAGDFVRKDKKYHLVVADSSRKLTKLDGLELAADNSDLVFVKKAQILRIKETGQFIYQFELESGRVSYYNQSGTKLNLTRNDLTSWIKPGWPVIYQDKIGVSVDGGVQLGNTVINNVDMDDIQVLCPGDIVTFQGKTSIVSPKKGDKWVADNGQVYQNQPDGWGVTDDGLWLSPSKVLYKIIDAKLKTVSFTKYKGEPVQAVHEEVVPLEVKNAVLGIRVGECVVNIFSGQRAEIIDINLGKSVTDTILGISIEGGDRQPVYCSAWAAKTGLMPVRSARTRECTDLKGLKLGEGFTQMGELMLGDVVKKAGSQDIAGVVLRVTGGQVSLGFGSLASACEYEIVGKATLLNSPALGEFWVYENFRWCGATGKRCYTGYWLWSGGNEYVGPDNKLYVLANEKFEMVSVYSELKNRDWVILSESSVPTSVMNMQANLAIGEAAGHIYTGDIELICGIDLPFVTLGDKKIHSSLVVPLSQMARLRDLKTGKTVSYKDTLAWSGFRMLGEFHVGDVVKVDGELVCLITKCKVDGRFLTSKGVTDSVENMEWVGVATLKAGFWVYDNIKWNAGTGEIVKEWKVSEGGVYFAPNGFVYQITHPHWHGVSIFTFESFNGCEPKVVEIKVEEVPFAVLNAYHGIKVGSKVNHLFTGKEFVVSEIRTGIVEVENGVSFNSWVMVGQTNFRVVRDTKTGKIRRASSDPSSEKLLGQLSPGDYVQHIAGGCLRSRRLYSR